MQPLQAGFSLRAGIWLPQQPWHQFHPAAARALHPRVGAAWELHVAREVSPREPPAPRSCATGSTGRRGPTLSSGRPQIHRSPPTSAAWDSSIPGVFSVVAPRAGSPQRWFPAGRGAALPARSVPSCRPAAPLACVLHEMTRASATADVTATSGLACSGGDVPLLTGAKAAGAAGKGETSGLPT